MSGLRIQIKAVPAGGEIKQIAWIEINNIEFGNSFGPQEAHELMDFLDGPKAKIVSAIIWTNELGFPFCRGGNLKYYGSLATKLEGLKANREIRKSLLRLSTLPIPTLALVRGDAFGGGLELISCFDVVISTPAALLGFWQRRIGLTFGWGGGQRALNRLTSACLRRLALESASISAYEALTLGLVDQIVPADLSEALVVRRLKEILNGSPETCEAIKMWSAKAETKIFEDLWFSPEHRAKTSRPVRG